MTDILEFDPVLFSQEDNEFLLENLGKPTVVALKNAGPMVLPAAVRPILDKVVELESLKEHEKQPWVGVEAIKDAIKVWFRENARWAHDHKRNPRAPRWPSLYSYDAKGKAHRSGPGADTGRVRTYFDEKGGRHKFAIQLLPDYAGEWVAPGFTEASTDPHLFEDAETHRIECRVPIKEGETTRICGHTESYKADSRASRSAARARMSKHLRKATDSVDLHRELHTNEFGG